MALTKPCAIMAQSPSSRCRPIIGVVSGCHDVPEPSRLIEYGPSGLCIDSIAGSSIDMPFIAAMSWPGMDAMSCTAMAGATPAAEDAGAAGAVCAWTPAHARSNCAANAGSGNEDLNMVSSHAIRPGAVERARSVMPCGTPRLMRLRRPSGASGEEESRRSLETGRQKGRGVGGLQSRERFRQGNGIESNERRRHRRASATRGANAAFRLGELVVTRMLRMMYRLSRHDGTLDGVRDARITSRGAARSHRRGSDPLQGNCQSKNERDDLSHSTTHLQSLLHCDGSNVDTSHRESRP